MNKVFIINGSARSGKDTFVELFNKCAIYDVLNISTIDPINRAIEALGIPNYKNDQRRAFAYDMKDLCTKHYNLPYNYIINTLYDSHLDLNYGYAFVHCREPEEIEKLKNGIRNDLKIDCKTILIRRKLSHIPDNHADQNVENYHYDYYIDNNGTLDDYANKVVEFYENMIG